MRHIDELDILDHLGRGTKAKESSLRYSIKSHQQKHCHFSKNISQSTYSPQKAVDMVRTAQKRHKLFIKY